MAKIDTPAVTSSNQDARGKRWIDVPEKDLFDFPYPTLRVNLQEFGPGKHFVDADLADFLEERMKIKYQADVRIMRPSQDYTSQNIMNRFGIGARSGGQHVANPDAAMPG